MSIYTTFIASRTTVYLIQTATYHDDIEIEDVSMDDASEAAVAGGRSPSILMEDVVELQDTELAHGLKGDARVKLDICVSLDGAAESPSPSLQSKGKEDTYHLRPKRARAHSPPPSPASSIPVPLKDVTATLGGKEVPQLKGNFCCPVVTCQKYHRTRGDMAKHLKGGPCRKSLGIEGKVTAANVTFYMGATPDEGETADALVAMFENAVAGRGIIDPIAPPGRSAGEGGSRGVGLDIFGDDDNDALTDLSNDEEQDDTKNDATELREPWIAEQGEDRGVVFSQLPSQRIIDRYRRAYNIIDADHLVFEGLNRCIRCQSRSSTRALPGRPIFGCYLMLKYGEPVGACACCAVTAGPCRWAESAEAAEQTWADIAVRKVSRFVNSYGDVQLRDTESGSVNIDTGSPSIAFEPPIATPALAQNSLDGHQLRSMLDATAAKTRRSGTISKDRRSTRLTRRYTPSVRGSTSSSPDPIQLSDLSKSRALEDPEEQEFEQQHADDNAEAEGGGQVQVMATREDDDEAVVDQLREDRHPSLAYRYSIAYAILRGRHCVMEGASRCHSCVRIDLAVYRATPAPHFGCILEVTEDGLPTGRCMRCLSRGGVCSFGTNDHPSSWFDNGRLVEAVANPADDQAGDRSNPILVASDLDSSLDVGVASSDHPGLTEDEEIVASTQSNLVLPGSKKLDKLESEAPLKNITPATEPSVRSYADLPRSRIHTDLNEGSGAASAMQTGHFPSSFPTSFREDSLKRISARAASLVTKLSKVEADDLFYNAVIIDLSNQATFWHQGSANGPATVRFARQAPVMKDRLFAALDASVAVIEAEAGVTSLPSEWEDVVEALDSLVQLLKRSAL